MSASEVLVTGGTGALGRRIVERFEEVGVGSRVLSRSGRPGTYKGDLITGEGLEQAVSGVDTIVHCASSPFRKARQTDVEGTKRLLAVAAGTGVSHLVYISRNPYPTDLSDAEWNYIAPHMPAPNAPRLASGGGCNPPCAAFSMNSTPERATRALMRSSTPIFTSKGPSPSLSSISCTDPVPAGESGSTAKPRTRKLARLAARSVISSRREGPRPNRMEYSLTTSANEPVFQHAEVVCELR
jgi:hypothetical protein